MRILSPLMTMLAAFSFYAAPVSAAETQSFAYDAFGRLVKVDRSGTVNNGVQTTYQFDKTGNRTRVIVSGSQARAGRVVVIPMLGYQVIPLAADPN